MRSAKKVYGDRGQEEAREKSKVCSQKPQGDRQTEVKVRHGAAELRRQKQNQEFKASVGLKASLRPAWPSKTLETTER